MRIVLSFLIAAVSPACLAAQPAIAVGAGAVRGVPGLSSAKWGTMIGLGAETHSRARFTVEGDFVNVSNAARCCGPPGGFTYDDRAILEMFGAKYALGSAKLQLELAVQAGAEEYREFRSGSVPGFNPPPTSWHALALVEGGAGVTVALSHTASLRFELRDYRSIASAEIGITNHNPAVLLFLRWH